MLSFVLDSAKKLLWVCVFGVIGMAFTVCHAVTQQDAIVQLKDDPYRRVVLENTIVRVWEVRVPVGETTPFHEHKTWDTVSVRINSTEITNEPKGGLFNFARDFRLESGSVFFHEYSKDPYIHRLTPKGPNPHHVIEIELLGPPADQFSKGSERPGSTEVLDNPRIRASRVVLEPGKTIDPIARGRNILAVVVTGGRVHEESTTRGGPSRELRAGEVQWQSGSSPYSLRNGGTSSIVIVEVEVK